MVDKSDMYGQIAGLYKSKEYMAITTYYDQKNIFEILGVSRNENAHSNFLAWLLTPLESHGYGTFPIQQFLRLIALAAKTYPCNKKIPIDLHFLDELLIGTRKVASAIVKRENPTQSKKRMDLVLEVRFEDNSKTLPVIIENKVKTNEHDDQTSQYYEWAKNKYASEQYEDPLYVFLAPKLDLANALPVKEENICKSRKCKKGICKKGICRNMICKHDSYILISYQNIMDHVLGSCKEQDGSEYAKSLVKDYMRCLDSKKLDIQERANMATETETKELFKKFWKQNKNLLVELNEINKNSNEDEKLLKQFWKQNKELLLKVMGVLVNSNDKDISDEEKRVMQKLLKKRRDDTEYVFNGNFEQPLQKSQLVLEVVKQYVDEHPNTTFNELLEQFPKGLQGSLSVFKKISQIGDKNRFHDDKIKLKDSTIAVCNQWGIGVKGDNTIKFINHVTKELGYKIEEVK